MTIGRGGDPLLEKGFPAPPKPSPPRPKTFDWWGGSTSPCRATNKEEKNGLLGSTNKPFFSVKP